MKFYLVDGEVKFLTHKVEYKNRTTEFYDIEKKDVFVNSLQERGIEYTETEIEPPPQDITDKVEGKKFNTIAEARGYMDGTLPKSKLEILQETVDTLVLSALEG